MISAIRKLRCLVSSDLRIAYSLSAFGFLFGLFSAAYHYRIGPQIFLLFDAFLVCLSVFVAIKDTLRARKSKLDAG